MFSDKCINKLLSAEQCVNKAGELEEIIDNLQPVNSDYFISLATTVYDAYLQFNMNIPHEKITFLTKVYERTLLFGKTLVRQEYLRKEELTVIFDYKKEILQLFNKRNKGLTKSLRKIKLNT